MIVDPRYFHFLAFNNHMFWVCSIYLMLQNSYGLNDHQASIKSIITFKTFSIFSCLALLKEPMWQRFWRAGLFGRAIIPHISQVQPFYLYIFRLPKYHPLEIIKAAYMADISVQFSPDSDNFLDDAQIWTGLHFTSVLTVAGLRCVYQGCWARF